MKNSKPLVIESIRASMHAQGWPLHGLLGLEPAYAKDTLVTPYFFCSDVMKRPFESYLVEGVIGVVHQGFEKLWIENPFRDPKAPGLAVGLYITNFRELAGKHYIPSEGAFAGEVEVFCSAVTTILNRMPANEEQLVSAFQKDELHGFPARCIRRLLPSKEVPSVQGVHQAALGR